MPDEKLTRLCEPGEDYIVTIISDDHGRTLCSPVDDTKQFHGEVFNDDVDIGDECGNGCTTPGRFTGLL